MIKALFFDVGGVLVRTMDWSRRFAWEDRLGLGRGMLEPLVHGNLLHEQQERGELGFDDFWRETALRLGIAQDQVAQFREEFYAGDEVNLELISAIRGWELRGLKTGIISNAPPILRQTLTAQYDIAKYFDAITISGEVGVRKPDAAIYRHALKSLGVAANEAVFVDDLLPNIAGANAIGMTGIHFAENALTIDEITRLVNRNPAL
ncbi:MAG TPA: HAD family phosphatase [Thermoflexales bacterium]|nr:HAD family phosphatase [Thermoflexales bacterium]HQW36179.1 HAD family phosphatase [Thermoflexales bacterium]HQZ23535.1 HAD family phosphatase [Thermoflexales bacterium]HRA00460.1 HAD family phosphatase [Thermoflexales bacterium]